MGLVSYRPVVAALIGGWAIYFFGFLINHLRVRRRRVAEGDRSRRVFSARASDLGLLLEGVGILVVIAFRRSHPSDVSVLLPAASLSLAAGSIVFAWVALWHLGRQWRIRAVVTDDHALVTTGPYALVRHPIYTSLFGMLAATAILVAHWWAAIAGMLVYVAGTETRIRAEEGILARRFPSEFPAYRKRVAAWLPLARR